VLFRSDRTGRLACSYCADPKMADPARHDLEQLNAAVHAIRNHTANGRHYIDFIDIVDRWAPTEQRRTKIEDGLRAAAEGKGEDGCTSCARVKDSRGYPLHNPQHPGLTICQSCHATLKRVRAHDRYVDAELVPIVVLEWRQRHAGKQVSEAILDRLLASGTT